MTTITIYYLLIGFFWACFALYMHLTKGYSRSWFYIVLCIVMNWVFWPLCLVRAIQLHLRKENPVKMFGSDDCKHFEEEEGGCSINKGCGQKGGYCRPLWMDDPCYSLEKPNDEQLAAFGHKIYAHGDTLVTRAEDGRCWQLRPGDYMGELPEGELIFVKRAYLSD